MTEEEKACIGDYDPNEMGCDLCDDVDDCKARTPRVKLRKYRP